MAPVCCIPPSRRPAPVQPTDAMAPSAPSQPKPSLSGRAPGTPEAHGGRRGRGRSRRSRWLALLAAGGGLLAALLAPTALPAQVRRDPVLSHIGLQTALVGTSLWLWDRQRPAAERRSWRTWARQSVAGGAMLAGGQALVARGPFATAVPLGMVVQATGTSIVRNWGEQQGAFSRVRLPLYPLMLEWDRARGARPRVQLSAGATLALAAEIAMSPPAERRIDWAASAQTLGVVLEGSVAGVSRTADQNAGQGAAIGYHWFGVVRVAHNVDDRETLWRHELLHRQQHWRDRELFGAALNPVVQRHLPRPLRAAASHAPRWVAWDVMPWLSAIHWATLQQDYRTSWYEREVASWLPPSE